MSYLIGLFVLYNAENLEEYGIRPGASAPEDEDRELRWALAQFDYKSKTDDERKAWAIICKRLGIRKTTIRAKGV